MANGYTPITTQERQAYLQLLGSNPRAREIKDKDVLGSTYEGKYEEVDLDELYFIHAPNLDYYGKNYGQDTAEGYIANLVVQGYAPPAIKKEVDRLEAEGKLDSTRTKKDYYDDVDTFVKENRTVDYQRKQVDPYYKAGVPNPNQDYEPEDLIEFKDMVEEQRTVWRQQNGVKPQWEKVYDPNDKNGKRFTVKNITPVDPREEEFMTSVVSKGKEILRQKGITPYNDEILRRKGTVLGYGK
jgi:hypothetical protein